MFRNKTPLLLFCLIVVALVVTACGNQPVADDSGGEELIEMSVALSSPHVWIQPVIAECEGYYEEVGLNVEHVRFTSGRAAMDALIGGQADIATTAISPAIFAAFQDQKIAILAENARFPGEKITARVASGISTPADLTGKKIGVTLGSDVHFFLHSFLNHYGMTVDDVELVNLKPPDMVISLVRGDIDAFASWRPQPDNAKAEMGDDAIFLEQPAPPIHESLYFIVGMQDLVKENPEAYERFMKAMVMADEYAVANPEGTKECVAKVSEVDVEEAANLMGGYEHKVWLDKSLVIGSEQRAQWQMEYDLAPEGGEMPDFRSFVVEGPLEAVAPDRVSLD